MIPAYFNRCRPEIRFGMVLTFWMFVILPAAAQQFTNPRFSRFTINDGLSQSLIYAITQDKKGFMWFATRDGLNRFDGYEFKIYHHDPFDSTSLSDDAVTSLFVDSKGRLWAGALNGKLNLYDRNKDCFYHFLIGNTARISKITEDREGNLWVGTYGNGLFKVIFNAKNGLITQKIIHSFYRQGDRTSLHSDFIVDILAGHDGKLWVSTTKDSIQFAFPDSSAIRFHTPRFTMTVAQQKQIPGGIQFDTSYTRPAGMKKPIFSDARLVEDSLHRIWVGVGSGLLLLDQKTNNLIYFDYNNAGLQGGRIQSMCKVYSADRADHSLWLGIIDIGLGVFDLNTFSLQFVRNDPGKNQALLPGYLLSIYQDRSGCVWLGTNGSGLNKFDLQSALFPFPQYHNADRSLATKNLSILSFCETPEYLLIGAMNGFWKADKTTRLMKEISLDLRALDPDMEPSPFNLVYDMIPAGRDKIWLASSYGLYLYDPLTDKEKLYPINIFGNRMRDNRIYKLYDDGRGNIWCLTAYSFSAFNKARKTFTHYFYNHKKINGYSEPAYGDIYQDADGNFWLGTTDGLVYFDTLKKTFQHYTTHPSDSFSLSFNTVRCILPDPRQPGKYLWIGTAGGGLNKFDRDTRKFTHYTIKNGLPNNVIYGILPDEKGNLWLSTNKGLSRFNPVTEEFHNYTVQSGLQSNEFSSGAYYKNSQGKLYFGGKSGFNAFYPEQIRDDSHVPRVVFTDFRIFNHSVSIHEKNAPLRRPISETRSITLPYKDNTISFEVAGPDYANPSKIEYAYRLEPLNANWTKIGTNRLITFSNLSPGHYILHVKASNSNGIWNKKETSMKLVITPPFWKTWWAYTIYVLVLLITLYYFRKYRLKRLRLQNSLRIEKITSQKLKEMDHLKSRFFANISHEFRTPLTLLIGPLEDIMRGGDREKFMQFIPEMHRNSKRLLQLINQLLDLSRLDTGNYHIHTGREDIIPFVNQVVHSFSSLAERRGMTLTTEVGVALRDKLPAGESTFYFDEDIIEKILTNLLSNAFKYTPDGGKITVSMNLQENKNAFFELTVEDNGVGIPVGKLPFIFDRFYQANQAEQGQQESSGIGLSLVKELTELHKGKIMVNSEPDKGTAFTCLFPFNKKIITDAGEIKQRAGSVMNVSRQETGETVAENNNGHRAADMPRVLIVEDHQDVRKYIREKLKDTYAITEAENGREGLELALKQIPDLVISDVMMPVLSGPEIDGFQLCKQLKTNNLTSHIPVILLTARADDSDKITGLETGADAYLIKPFNAKELAVRVRKLIELRNKMRARFSDKLIVKPSEITVTSLDRQFVEKILAQVEEHIGDPQFSVEQLATEMNISASQMNRKLRAIINQSPQQFIRSVRMQKALELLKNNSGTIAEISETVGFGDPGYFSKVFKKHFGFLPSEKENIPG